MNRRQLMARAAALNVVLSVIPRAFAAPGGPARASRLERVVADLRFAPSVSFAAAMAAHGTPVSAIDGDLTSLWFDDLADHFAGSGTPVAGLTTTRTALVMIELAREPGVRVLWRAEHTPMPDGSLRHELRGTASLVTQAAGRDAAADWVGSLASTLADAPYGPCVQEPTVNAVMHSPPANARLEEPLTSWVLAPRHTGRGTAKVIHWEAEP